MKVFISWSGECSRQVALALREWLPCVIPNIKPWMSDKDIPAGERFFNFIMNQLNDTKFGIICLTEDNYESPYILFEAGALTKTINSKSLVCPYLFYLTPKELTKGPLIQFQAITADQEGTWKLIRSLNDSLGASAQNTENLPRIYEHWWPELESTLGKIRRPTGKNPQISSSISIKCSLPPYQEIEIKKLNKIKKFDRLELTWETLGSGIEYLAKEIVNSSAASPDLIFGINETGFIIASYLSKNLRSRPKLGLIQTGDLFALTKNGSTKFKRRILPFELPNIQFSNSDCPLSIAIVDFEIKSGVSVKDIINEIEARIKRDYHIDDIIFYYFVLCGVLKEGDEDKLIDDINYFGWDVSSKRKPDLIAYYIEHPGIRGPGGIR